VVFRDIRGAARQLGLGDRLVPGMRIHIDTGNGVANLAIYYFAFSFLEYWCHRICHSGLFWHLHRLHHAAATMSPLVEYRNHPGQKAFEMLFFAWPAGLIAVPLGYLEILGIIAGFYHMLIHADVGWRWGWVGRWVINSPAAHRLHHSADPVHFGKNLSVLILWDRLFGTWYDGDMPVTAIGVERAHYNRHGVLVDILRDYGSFARHVAVLLRLVQRRSVVAGPDRVAR